MSGPAPYRTVLCVHLPTTIRIGHNPVDRRFADTPPVLLRNESGTFSALADGAGASAFLHYFDGDEPKVYVEVDLEHGVGEDDYHVTIHRKVDGLKW